MRVLIIDNNIDADSWGARELRAFARLLPGAAFHVRRAPHRDLPASPVGFDRVIASGSKTSALADAPWIERFHEFIRRTVDNGIPYLGVCYGHQSLIRALGAKSLVRSSNQPEFGWTKIEQVSASRLMEGLPQTFYSFSSHFQEVSSVPQGFRVIARSEFCGIQAAELLDRPVFGIQFHPEKDLKSGERTLAYRRKVGIPEYLLNPHRGRDLYNETVGETLFRNFLK
ncbi:MAG: hypothetical protein A2X94_04385 [Bdellovibrionales bacterium GWB1_55_8]|nr:MAG: hypothetical protein A2X94_04385 [Bdellovibrionales bacterium GWB1_55_8]